MKMHIIMNSSTIKSIHLKLFLKMLLLWDLSEISGGGRGVETEGGSQLFESAEKEGVMKNGRLKGGGSCKYVSVIM